VKEKHDHRITVSLTRRQAEALRAYAASQGVKPGPYVRLLVTDDVPREFYDPIPPPPGQMILGEHG